MENYHESDQLFPGFLILLFIAACIVAHVIKWAKNRKNPKPPKKEETLEEWGDRQW